MPPNSTPSESKLEAARLRQIPFGATFEVGSVVARLGRRVVCRLEGLAGGRVKGTDGFEDDQHLAVGARPEL